MNHKHAFKKFIGTALVGGMMLSLGGVALAGSETGKAQGFMTQGFFANKGMGLKQGFKDPVKSQENIKLKLAELVKNGTLTQAKADKVAAYFAQCAKERMQKIQAEKQKPLDKLVKGGAITRAEADAIIKVIPNKGLRKGGAKKYMQGTHGQYKHEIMKEKLLGLVKSGTLTQEKADKIVNYISKHAETRKAEFEKIKAMTPEESKEYMTKIRTERKDLLTELVTDGVITQKEADAIKEAMPFKGKGRGFRKNS